MLIDFGTSIPASTRNIGADLAKKGAGMIDAPLGRTPAHAKDGLRNIMAAGEQQTFDKVKSMLDVLGENVFYLGALGASELGFSIANANKDPAYFLQMAEDLGTRAEIGEGTSRNLQAAFDAGMGDGKVPEIFDYFLKLKT